MAGDAPQGERRRHDFLSSLAESCAGWLMSQRGMDTQTAADLGNSIADFVSEHYAGQHVYFVKDDAFRLDKRDRLICAEMERGNAVDVAAKYGISDVRVYQIVRRYRAELQARAAAAQRDMFVAPTPARGAEA